MKAHHTFTFSFTHNTVTVVAGPYSDILLATLKLVGSEWEMEYWLSENNRVPQTFETLEDAMEYLNNSPYPMYDYEDEDEEL